MLVPQQQRYVALNIFDDRLFRSPCSSAFVTLRLFRFCFSLFSPRLCRTRGSPDMAQPPSSSNSSTTSSPSRRTAFQRRLFWPINYLWGNKARPVPGEDPSGNHRSNGISKVEISRPMPLQLTKTVPTSTSQPPSSSLAKNLVGQYKGFTLSPLSEQADSSFADAAAAEAAVPVSAAKSSNGVQQKNKEPKSSGIVAARANFFSSGSKNAAGGSGNPPAPTSVPVRPAPAAPVRNPSPVAADAAAPVHPPGHVEITITKKIVPVDNPTEQIIIKEVIKPTVPQKGRPLSALNPYSSFKSIFSRAEPQPQPPPQQKSSIFKAAAPAQHVVVNVPEPPAATSSASEVDNKTAGTALPRHQSIKAAKINRESLRQLEISNPIPQSAIEIPSKAVPVRPAPAPPSSTSAAAPSPPPPALPVKVPPPIAPALVPASATSKLGISSTLPRLPKGNKVHFADQEEKSETDGKRSTLPTVVERSESMRMRGVTNRPNIPQFGSMRGKRPVSMPFARPTSPPPNPPTAISPVLENDYPYDDCSKATGDGEGNIYASIEELQASAPLIKRQETGSTTTSNSDGLLSEIVSELKKKNLDEMYSVAAPKKPLPTVPSTTTTTASKPTATAPLSMSVLASKSAQPKPSTAASVITSKPSAVPSTTAAVSSSVPAPTTSSLPTISSAGYKPYSSAWRSRYTGGAISSLGATPSSAASTATVPANAAPKLSTFAAPASVPKLSTFSTTTPSAAASTALPEKSSVVNPVPLPATGPVGKIPTSTAAASDKSAAVPATSDKKPVTSSEVAKPSVPVLSSINAAKSKPITSKTVAAVVAGKPTIAGAKVVGPAASSSAKVTKAPGTKTTTTPASSNASTSSLGGASTASSSKSGPSSSSSIVHSMQQKFDASKPSNGNKTGASQPAKGKAMPKR